MIRAETTIDISASPDLVWSTLVGFADYPQWSPTLRRISGELVAGQHLSVTALGPGGREVTFKPRLLDVRPREVLRWRARLLMPGVLTGVHEFVLEPRGKITHVIHADNYSGVLVPLVRKLLAENTSRMELQNTALKARAEQA
jgi:hypothetical protein